MSRSNFPVNIDTFVEHRELSNSELTSLARWRSLKAKNNKTPSEITEFEALSDQLANAMFTSEDMNKLQDSIVAVQAFFKNEVDGYIDTMQSNVMEHSDEAKESVNRYVDEMERDMTDFIDNLQSQYVFLGQWQEDITYVKYNNVYYGGSSYSCLRENKGQPPNPNIDTIYWAKMAERGLDPTIVARKSTTTLNGVANSVPVGIPTFNEKEDILFVSANGSLLTEGIDYTINDGTIIKTSGTWDSGTSFSFVALDTVTGTGFHIIDVILNLANWVLLENGYYRYRYVNPLISSIMLVNVLFQETKELDKAKKSGVLSMTVEGDGYVDIFARALPDEDIAAQVHVFVDMGSLPIV